MKSLASLETQGSTAMKLQSRWLNKADSEGYNIPIKFDKKHERALKLKGFSALFPYEDI